MGKAGNNHNMYKNLVFVSQLSIHVMVPAFLCLFLGLYLDEKFSTCFAVPLLFLGLAAGGRNAYLMAMQSVEEEAARQKKREREELEEIVKRHQNKT